VELNELKAKFKSEKTLKKEDLNELLQLEGIKLPSDILELVYRDLRRQ